MSGSVDAGAGFRPRVLIVDDTPANLLAYRTLLEHARRDVDLASSAHDALALTLAHDYSVLLIDLRMPVTDGAELALILRSRPRTFHTPIIFMSAYDQMPEQVAKGVLIGAFDFVLTPANPEVFLRKVEAFEAAHRSRYLMAERIRFLEQENQELRHALFAERAEDPAGERPPSDPLLAPVPTGDPATRRNP